MTASPSDTRLTRRKPRFLSARRIRELEGSALTMSPHSVKMQKSMMMSGFPNRKQTHRAELSEIGVKIKAAIDTSRCG